MRRITVVGAGNCSFAAAADLAVRGNEINMLVDTLHWPDVEKIAAEGFLWLHENGKRRKADINMVTDDPFQAIKGSSLVLITIPAYGHDLISDLIADCLEDGQTVLFAPGYFGGLQLRRRIKKSGRNVFIAETNETLVNARKLDDMQVEITGRTEQCLISAIPSSDTTNIIDRIGNLFQFKKAENILHTVLSATNPCYHVPGCILNTGGIERSKGEFYLYEQGITPAVAEVMEQLDRERVSILKKLGYPHDTLAAEMAEGRQPRSIWEEINGCCELEFVKGPGSLQSRYLTEDIPYGLMAWQAIGQILDMELPVTTALITLGGIVIGEHWIKKGCSLKQLGLESSTQDDLFLSL